MQQPRMGKQRLSSYSVACMARAFSHLQALLRDRGLLACILFKGIEPQASPVRCALLRSGELSPKAPYCCAAALRDLQCKALSECTMRGLVRTL